MFLCKHRELRNSKQKLGFHLIMFSSPVKSKDAWSHVLKLYVGEASLNFKWNLFHATRTETKGISLDKAELAATYLLVDKLLQRASVGRTQRLSRVNPQPMCSTSLFRFARTSNVSKRSADGRQNQSQKSEKFYCTSWRKKCWRTFIWCSFIPL